MNMNWPGRLVVGAGIVLLAGCATLTRVDVQSAVIKNQKKDMTVGRTMSLLTGVLVDHGFDIKLANKDSGLLTTEYKKFESQGTNPPFDYYLQVRARVRQGASGLEVQLSPFVKEQNRLNSAAFTEHELRYYLGPEHGLSHDMRRILIAEQLLFRNVVTAVAEGLGTSLEDVEEKVTKTSGSVFLIKDMSGKL